jgi:DNA repair exonuclease SbcCD nuclease subunit
MARFLHLADIHLGFDRYDNKERTQDFFFALQDVLQTYAIDAEVDFVLIVGDFFEHRNILPSTLNQAQLCLYMLREAGIPVLAIEGNHDNRPYGTKTSWLRYLADWGLLILLEPGNIGAGEPFYSPWQNGYGGYIDLDCGVRVLGANWYGSAAPRAIEQIAAEIRNLPPGPNHTILLFHHGLEGQIARYAGALRYNEMLPLRVAGVDYLALGHIHKNYEVEGWMFNPGSLEANSIEESGYDRGVYLVDIGPHGIIATLKQDYYQRAVVRLSQSLRGTESQDEVEQGAAALVQQAIASGQIDPDAKPIVELRITGQIGFDRLDLDIRHLQQHLQQISNALIFLLKFEVDEVAYLSHLAEDANRLQIEQEIFTDLLMANNSYKNRAAQLAQGLIDLKNRQLEGQPESELYEFIATLLQGQQGTKNA